LEKNIDGQSAYLFGKKHQRTVNGAIKDAGVWYFFLVALAYKSPLPFLVLALIGMARISIGACSSRRWQTAVPVFYIIAMLLLVIRSNINIGVRHILPIYPLLAITAGYGTVMLWELDRMRWIGRSAVICLVAWQIVSCARAYPDYFPYFNELAGRHPEHILIDSDLDWGQDLKRLSDALRERNIKSVALQYPSSAESSLFNLPECHVVVPNQPGWVAINVSGFMTRDNLKWLNAYTPVVAIGKSALLYYIPEPSVQ
jgi:hypothetical protein